MSNVWPDTSSTVHYPTRSKQVPSNEVEGAPPEQRLAMQKCSCPTNPRQSMASGCFRSFLDCALRQGTCPTTAETFGYLAHLPRSAALPSLCSPSPTPPLDLPPSPPASCFPSPCKLPPAGGRIASKKYIRLPIPCRRQKGSLPYPTDDVFQSTPADCSRPTPFILPNAKQSLEPTTRPTQPPNSTLPARCSAPAQSALQSPTSTQLSSISTSSGRPSGSSPHLNLGLFYSNIRPRLGLAGQKTASRRSACRN